MQLSVSTSVHYSGRRFTFRDRAPRQPCPQDGRLCQLRNDLSSVTKINEGTCIFWELNSYPLVSVLVTRGSSEVLRAEDPVSWNVMPCTLVVHRLEECTASIFRVVKYRRRDGELWFKHLIMKEKEKMNQGFFDAKFLRLSNVAFLKIETLRYFETFIVLPELPHSLRLRKITSFSSLEISIRGYLSTINKLKQ